MTKPWRLLSRRAGAAGYLPLWTETYELPDGTHADWDICGRARAVAVLALTPDGEIVLARQFRPGPQRVLDELPGGIVEDGEAVLDAAARELREETGYGGQCELAGTTWLSSFGRTQRFAVVCREARRIGPPAPDAGEFCEVVHLSLTAFRDHLRSGQLSDADLGYLALDHLGLLGRPGHR
jgi:ADP-ribose pyrophosphatase